MIRLVLGFHRSKRNWLLEDPAGAALAKSSATMTRRGSGGSGNS